MGPLVRLPPGVVIFAILAGGSLAGAFCLFISISIAAVIWIILNYLYRKLTDQPEVPSDTDQPQVDVPIETVTGEMALGSQG
jgi:predicted PurR-regulated permease PerM